MENPICNTVFDSRDLIEYRDELAENLVYSWNDYKKETAEEDEEGDEATDISEVDLNIEGFRDRYEEDIEHYEAIAKFCDELEEMSGFEYGIQIIHESYFTEYCQELMKELGYIPKDFPGFIEIDWEQTANNLQSDYTIFRFDGEDYLTRDY